MWNYWGMTHSENWVFYMVKGWQEWFISFNYFKGLWRTGERLVQLRVKRTWTHLMAGHARPLHRIFASLFDVSFTFLLFPMSSTLFLWHWTFKIPWSPFNTWMKGLCSIISRKQLWDQQRQITQIQVIIMSSNFDTSSAGQQPSGLLYVVVTSRHLKYSRTDRRTLLYEGKRVPTLGWRLFKWPIEISFNFKLL